MPPPVGWMIFTRTEEVVMCYEQFVLLSILRRCQGDCEGDSQPEAWNELGPVCLPASSSDVVMVPLDLRLTGSGNERKKCG